MEAQNLLDVDPVKFAEIFPDPQDYCIGVVINYEPIFHSPRKSEHIKSLDARIE